MRGTRTGGEIAAITAAVDAELHELVAHAEDNGAGQVRRVGRHEFKVACSEARDGIAVDVGARQVAVVNEIHRPAQYPDAARRKVGAEHAALPRYERGGVQGELVVR